MVDAPVRIRVSVDFAKATLNFPEGPKNRTVREYVRADVAVLARAGVEVPGNQVAQAVKDLVVEVTQAEIDDQWGPDVDKPGWYTASAEDGELVKGPFDTREQAAAQL